MKDGSLIWKYRADPSEEKVIGNGRNDLPWPVRTGVLVDGGMAFFAAGVFPYEGLYICALIAAAELRSGKTIPSAISLMNCSMGNFSARVSSGVAGCCLRSCGTFDAGRV
jgi:hypothetical protein